MRMRDAEQTYFQTKTRKRLMIMRSMLVLFKWIAALGLILGFFYGAYLVRGQMQAERAQEGDDDKKKV